ncbi:YceI family protein [Sporosarcina sp. 179-K 3D1 HS]|uniref:YceI family protein n=1 Tax=Sporosarcina sp. 179-K 3D1 HS TaxID=3232169 RepID=UPI0039A21475
MTTWVIDSSHSNIGFTVKHMMVSKVRGNFESFKGTIEGNPEDLANANIEFSVDMSTINTNSEDRDNHLRSADFFDAETHPEMKFVSTAIAKTDDDEYDVTGDLTIKGVTKKVTFEAEYEGKATNPWGQEVVGFTVKGKIKRKDFGLTWNQALETGGVLVGDDVKIIIELEANPAQ